LGGGRVGLDILSKKLGLGKNETAALLNLLEISRQNMKIDTEAQKTTDETYNTIENINKRALNFYDDTAMKMLATLGTISTGLVGAGATGVMGAGGIGSVLGGFAGKGRFKKGMKGMGKLGGAGTVAMGGMALTAGVNAFAPDAGEAMDDTLNLATMGASIGTMIAPGLGTAVGAAIGGVVGIGKDIYDAVSETAENTREELELKKEERRKQRAEEAAREVQRASLLADYLRSRTDEKFGAQMVANLEEANRLGRLRLEQRSGLASRKE